jgi:putative hydrolase
MIITSDLHTHTVFSHGTGSVEDNVRAAIAKGLEQIAIADHSVGHIAYGVRDIEGYLKEIDRVKTLYKDSISVKSALELNILNEEGLLDLPSGYQDSFDMLLFGYHKFAAFTGFFGKLRMLLPKSESEKAVEKNTRAYINAINRYKIDIITHPGYGLPINKIEIAKAAAEKGTYLEINNKHPEFTIPELLECIKTGVRFSINSDAHSPERVGDIAHALNKAIEAKIPAEMILNAKEEQ